jgi:hypothetical protein
MNQSIVQHLAHPSQYHLRTLALSAEIAIGPYHQRPARVRGCTTRSTAGIVSLRPAGSGPFELGERDHRMWTWARSFLCKE